MMKTSKLKETSTVVVITAVVLVLASVDGKASTIIISDEEKIARQASSEQVIGDAGHSHSMMNDGYGARDLQEDEDEYPIVNFFFHQDSEPTGSFLRNAAFLVGHVGFGACNIFNLLYVTLFEMYAFGNFGTNFLSKLAFIAFFSQVLSCITSIHRYNINDEYGPYAIAGTHLGLFAYIPFNVAYWFLLFPKSPRVARFGAFGWIVINALVAVTTHINFDTVQFDYFRVYVGLSSLYHVVVLILSLRALTNEVINIDASIVSKEVMAKVFHVCIGVQVVCLLAGSSGMPVFVYPATGITFIVLNVVTIFAGRMDFMMPSAITTGGEEEVQAIVDQAGGNNYSSTS